MIVPYQSGDALLADIRRSALSASASASASASESGDTNATNPPQQPHGRLWWLGQSGFLLQYGADHLLFDPYLSDSLTVKYAHTDKPHERMTERVIDPARLDFIRAVTSTHNHTDHLDAETLLPLLQVNPELEIIVANANRQFAADRLGLPAERLTALDAGDSTTVGPFRVHAIPAAHENLDRNSLGEYCYLGFVVECGPWKIYHSGDTVRYTTQLAWLSAWQIDVALLPINGRTPERRVSGNLWGREAAQLAHDIDAKLVIPCHYEMFRFNTADPAEFIQRCEELGQSYRVLRAGEGWTL